ncbi:MAG: gluconate 2-dehydrogenase subunit 3 family protein [Mycobacteriales bacterium]
MAFLDETERAVLAAAAARLLPVGSDPAVPLDLQPGAAEAGVPDYIEGVLDAFSVDPPRIFAGGPSSGRAGGDGVNHFSRFLPLGRLEELAWRIRLEGSRGLAQREFAGPVRGWQEVYRDGLAALGAGYPDLPGEEQDALLEGQPELRELLWEHCCEGMYAAPEYGGNRDLVGWRAIDFPGDVIPRGWTDEEVSGP